MKTNAATENGNKKKPYKRVKTRTGPNFNWKDYEEGRTAKCLIILIVEEKVSPGESYSRKFRQAGLTKKWLHDELIRFMPWLPEMYREHRGCELKPNIVYDRWHKMVYQTKPGPGNSHTVGQSSEHPRDNAKLQKCLGRVEKLFKRNLPISKEEAIEAGTI